MAFPRRTLVTVVAAATLALGGSAAATAGAGDPVTADANAATSSPGEVWKKTTLYFGTGKPDGSEVTPAEFQVFSDKEITGAFPDGFTRLAADGQFKGANGEIVREHSYLVILLYPLNDRKANREIEDIRADYKKEFQQESVLRTDTVEKVSF
ncbi:DUF3574 domain-containing protein [Amycolatopsis sp. cg5]|uniref:DUF3574 domain-containing protein n=1 Tax=Amycolatopsis sp. cg5 TaxID=3238802 RepID=UPI00352670CB